MAANVLITNLELAATAENGYTVYVRPILLHVVQNEGFCKSNVSDISDSLPQAAEKISYGD
jgi:hypothetical protein